MNKDRITFFSKVDLSRFMYFEKIETLLDGFDEEKFYDDINDVVELYHIKKFFDTGVLPVSTWTEEQTARYMTALNHIHSIIARYFDTINDDNALELFNKLEFSYKETFWEILNKFGKAKNLTAMSLKNIWECNSGAIRDVLENENLVKIYHRPIYHYLMEHGQTAELILDIYVKAHDSDYKPMYLPRDLTLEDKECLILNYLDKKEPNLNYVRLAKRAVDKVDFRLSPETHLKAEQVEKVLNEKVLKEGITISRGIKICIDGNVGAPPKKEEWEEDGVLSLTYGYEHIKRGSDEELIYNFANLFDYIDQNGLINLLSNKQEADVMEMFMIHGEKEYPVFSEFRHKQNKAQLQMMAYSNALKNMDCNLEEVIKSFFTKHFRDQYGCGAFEINLPKGDISYLNMNRCIAPEIESIFRQHDMYATYGRVDEGLIAFGKPMRIGDVHSCMNTKYIYEGNEFQEMEKISYLLFSNQSMLYYVDPYKGKYSTLIAMLYNEQLKKSQFENYQVEGIDYLIEKGYLMEKEDIIYLTNNPRIRILHDLYFDGVCAYWHYHPIIKVEMDKMVKQGLLRTGNTLLSEPEIKYFNYYLNDSEFSNGLSLRNAYMHGGRHKDENKYMGDYLYFLILVVLMALKMDEDLKIAQILKANGLDRMLTFVK